MKYKELIDKMTLEEKASLCVGGDYWHSKAIEKLNIPSITMSDGPHGLRVQKTKADNLGISLYFIAYLRILVILIYHNLFHNTID